MIDVAKELNAKWMGIVQLADYRATITVNALKKAQAAF